MHSSVSHTQPRKAKSMKGRIIGALSLLVVAAIVAVGSSASFTAHSANPGNMVTSGTFSVSNDKEGQAIFAAQSAFDPGEHVAGAVTIGNAGNEPGTFTLSGTNQLTGTEATANAAFNDNLSMTVTEYTDQASADSAVSRYAQFVQVPVSEITTQGVKTTGGFKFSGKLSQFLAGTCAGATSTQCVETPQTDNKFDLANWANGEKHYYVFTIENNSAPNTNQGKKAQYEVDWDAITA